MRSIQNFHMNSRGWSDIAYHYCIDSDGLVYEGRTWGVVGGATFGENDTSHAVCLLGNFNNERPTKKAIDALVEVIQWGHDLGYVPNEITGGHRDYRATSCPGGYLYRLIPTINEQAQEDTMTPEQEAKLDKLIALEESAPKRFWGFPAASGTQAGKPISMHFQADRTYRGVEDLWVALASGKLTEMSPEELARLQGAIADEIARRLGQ